MYATAFLDVFYFYSISRGERVANFFGLLQDGAVFFIMYGLLLATAVNFVGDRSRTVYSFIYVRSRRSVCVSNYSSNDLYR